MQTESKPIERLPATVIARIAAGEMITRPAAALKELLENALDAEATRITIAIRESLDRWLEVADDGCGIPGDELMLALERHTTSKIRCEDDLLRVVTLGFRGEALASIAEIARLTLTSRARSSEHAWMVRVEGGKAASPVIAARAPGTTVLVEDLFFNTPVRKRFLRSPSVELRTARATILSHALSAPGVGWVLEQDGRRTLDLPPARDLSERIAQVYGSRIGSGLLHVDARDGETILRGMIGVPELARAGRQHQTFFVNGRWISSAWLGQAVRQGYGDLIPGNQNPWAVLFITLPPDRLDVNLHPTKQEIRFLDERVIFGAVQRAVHQAVAQLLPRFFHGADLEAPDGRMPGASDWNRARGAATGDRGAGGGDAAQVWRDFAKRAFESRVGDGRQQAERIYGGMDGAGSVADQSREAPSDANQPDVSQPPDVNQPRESVQPDLLNSAQAPPDAEAFGEAMDLTRPLEDERGALAEADGLVSLWQLHRTYVLAQTRKGLLIIDQHAAHERILYEQMLDRMSRGLGGAQQLMIPVVQELTAPEMDLFREIQDSLAQMGFDVLEFGEDSVLIRGVPTLWRVQSEAQLLRDLLDEAADTDLRPGETLENLARAFACRAAIKAGTQLSMQEMNRLVDELFATRLPHGDPHGRPTFVFISVLELNRRFGRGGGE